MGTTGDFHSHEIPKYYNGSVLNAQDFLKA